MSAEHKRLEIRGLCNIDVLFDTVGDTSEAAVRRIVTNTLLTRGLGSRAGDWKLWKHEGARGVGGLAPIGRNVIPDLKTVRWCWRSKNKNNFYVTPQSDPFTLAELRQLPIWYENYSPRTEDARWWAGWMVIDKKEREELLDADDDSATSDSFDQGGEEGEGEREVEVEEEQEQEEPYTSIGRRRSRERLGPDDDEYYPPSQRQRRVNAISPQATDNAPPCRRRGHPPRVIAPTIRSLERPTSPPIVLLVPGSTDSPASSPSPSLTEIATPEQDFDVTPIISRRSQLADPDSDISCFESIISKMFQRFGPDTQTREEDRPIWLFEHNPSNWLRVLFGFINSTPWEMRTASPHPRVDVEHQYYQRGSDCGGVFRTFIHKVIQDFVGGEDFVDGGILGRTFCEDPESAIQLLGLEPPPPPRFGRYETFGRLMASYIFCHRDFPWPRGLDPVIFLMVYFRFRGMRYAPHSSRVSGCVGSVMRILEVCGGGLLDVPEVVYNVTDSLSWPREIVKENLLSHEGVESLRTSMYWETHWRMRSGALDAFVRGLNERNLFQTMVEDVEIQVKDIDCWLLQSGVPSSESVDGVLTFSSGHRVEDCGQDFQGKFERVKSLLEGWIKWSGEEGNLESLDWLVKEIIGTSFVWSTKLTRHHN